MTWTETLFAFRGRTNRAPYWIASLALTVLAVLIVMAAMALVAPDVDGGPPTGLFMLGGIAALVFGYISLALNVKRLHDRDKSAWWILLFFVLPGAVSVIADQSGSQPAVLGAAVLNGVVSLWAFVELGFFRGTHGTNRFGPDPLTY